MWNRKIIQPKAILFLYIIINLIIGFFIVPDYGRSTDESVEDKTSELALSIYTSEIIENPVEKYEEIRHNRYYGTASTALIKAASIYLSPNTSFSEWIATHYSYFVFFQIAIISIFYLGKFFFDEWISLFISILFGTQPLLFGHAFINPKDIPLLTVFLSTVVIGFAMVDRWFQNDASAGNIDIDSTQNNSSTGNRTKKKNLFILILLSLFLFFWCGHWITNLILNMVEYSYNTKESSSIGKIFASITTFGSLEGYLRVTHLYILEIYRWISFGTPLLLLLLFLYAQRNQLFNNHINLIVLLGAAGWGFAISTRILAVAAGGIVGLYALIKLKEKAIIPLIIYSITASIISYITWPFLWIFGFKGYIEAFTVFSDFSWDGRVLFEGQFFHPHDLPIKFLPKLMMLQFTEPLVILALIGFLISLFMLYKRTINANKLMLLYAWFFLPLFYIMISNATVYSNFRHFLFITPPIFIFSGFTLQQISFRVKKRAWITVIYWVILIPGLVSIFQIHPFQYLYYNAFTGGIEGANHNYELDYWNLAYKDAMDYVNENIPSGSKIMIWKDNLLAKEYANKYFQFAVHTDVPEEEYKNFDYAIVPIRQIENQSSFAKYPIIFSVDIDNVSLVVVLKMNNDAD